MNPKQSVLALLRTTWYSHPELNTTMAKEHIEKRSIGRPKKVVKTKSPKKSPKSKAPAKSKVPNLKATPTKPSIEINDGSLKATSFIDKSTPVSSNTQSSEKEHGLVNQDDTLKTAEKPPEKNPKSDLSYKKVLLNTIEKTMTDPSSYSTF